VGGWKSWWGELVSVWTKEGKEKKDVKVKKGVQGLVGPGF